MKIKRVGNTAITQVLLIVLIIFLGIVIITNLKYFVTGFLGAITLYILFRKTYFRLTEQKRWNKSVASIFLMVLSIVLIAIPIWILIEFMIPEFQSVVNNKQMLIDKFNAVKQFMESKPILDNINLSEEALMGYVQKLAAYIPTILNSVASVVINIITALFILYFMQVHAKSMEKKARLYTPFSEMSRIQLWKETEMMVRSNAIGIPILALCQGIVAIVGYWIFGVSNPVLWGLITGVATVVPVVGTMVVWVPISIIVLASGEIGNAIGLFIYCFIAVGGIDNVLRFTILKKIGDVPPLITVFGVLLGLNLFGMIGLIFGPLVLSYFLLLLKIYRNEFGRKRNLLKRIETRKQQQEEASCITENKE